MRNVLIFLIAFVLVGCAGSATREGRSGEIYLRHASEESTSSVLYGSIRGWRPAGDDAVLIEFNRNRYYLFELGAPCSTEIQFARSIALVTSTRQRVDQFDRIRVGDRTCRILAIREVDFEAARAELDALRAQPAPAREAVETNQAEDSGGT